jgi:toxin ParE1/3/4
MPQALAGLDAVHACIAQDDPVPPRKWVNRLRERARRAATAPRAGRVVPEVEQPGVREVFLRTYRLVYQVVGQELHVLTVFESHRLFPMDEAEADGD